MTFSAIWFRAASRAVLARMATFVAPATRQQNILKDLPLFALVQSSRMGLRLHRRLIKNCKIAIRVTSDPLPGFCSSAGSGFVHAQHFLKLQCKALLRAAATVLYTHAAMDAMPFLEVSYIGVLSTPKVNAVCQYTNLNVNSKTMLPQQVRKSAALAIIPMGRYLPVRTQCHYCAR